MVTSVYNCRVLISKPCRLFQKRSQLLPTIELRTQRGSAFAHSPQHFPNRHKLLNHSRRRQPLRIAAGFGHATISNLQNLEWQIRKRVAPFFQFVL